MALSVEDILKLPVLSSFELVAGRGGLDKAVISAGIADYEFAAGVDYNESIAFERDSMVISSLLFAKEDPDKILVAIRHLHAAGVSAFAYKPVFYDTLPEEVLLFADQHDFPIFSFGCYTWFENIIFDITNAVESDDSRYLTEKNIEQMIRASASQNELDRIRFGISLFLHKTVSAAYIRTNDEQADQIYRLYYISKGLRDKLLVAKYDGGVFLLITSEQSSTQTHRIILEEAHTILSLPISLDVIILSRIHPASELDAAFREAYFAWLSGLLSPKSNHTYDTLGVYTTILALADTPQLKSYATSYLAHLEGYEETIDAYIKNGGDITATSIDLHCHTNTVRYRLSKIKTLTGSCDATDNELFRDLSIAYIVKRALAIHR